jgi:RNA-binding protein
MGTLTPRKRSHLRALAHQLKPILHVGKEGVTKPALRTIDDAFNTRELLKLKVLDSSPETVRECGEKIANELDGVELIQVIGRTVVLYRRHPDKPSEKQVS